MLDASEMIIDKILEGLDPVLQDNFSECPVCSTDYHVRHESCEEYIDQCICPAAELEQESVFFCENCNVRFDPEGGWMKDMDDHGKTSDLPSLLEGHKELQLFDDDNDAYWNGVGMGFNKLSGVLPPPAAKVEYKPKCRHKHHEVKLYDGTSIYCSSVNQTLDDMDEQVTPDFGLYADHSWRPHWRNEFIDWPDMRIPSDRETSLQQIWEGYCRAADGQFVEIGCIGGHGRTGVILAGMYLAAADGQVTAQEAIDFVRKEYCDSAIETAKQEWFVNFISYQWFGEDLADEPEEFSYNSSGNGGTCAIPQHYAMIMRGWTHCMVKKDCNFWEFDVKGFAAPNQGDIEKALGAMKVYPLRPGGIVLEADKKKKCPETHHYSMLVNGHSECITLGEDCISWDNDMKIWNKTSTLPGVGSNPSTYVKGLVEEFPTVEEWSARDEQKQEDEPQPDPF